MCLLLWLVGFKCHPGGPLGPQRAPHPASHDFPYAMLAISVVCAYKLKTIGKRGSRSLALRPLVTSMSCPQSAVKTATHTQNPSLSGQNRAIKVGRQVRNWWWFAREREHGGHVPPKTKCWHLQLLFRNEPKIHDNCRHFPSISPTKFSIYQM